MMKQRLSTILILALVFFICLQYVFTANATETPSHIVEETYIPIEDHTFDNMGWLGMRALPPVGFCGIVCVDVKNTASGDVQTVQLEYGDMYIGGEWLDAGDYSIEQAYVANGDHFVVDSDTPSVHIEPGEKIDIELVIRENPEVAEQIEKEHSVFTPMSPEQPLTEATLETEGVASSTVAGAETQEATQEVTVSNNPEESTRSIYDLTIGVIVTILFVGMIFLVVFIVRSKYRK